MRFMFDYALFIALFCIVICIYSAIKQFTLGWAAGLFFSVFFGAIALFGIGSRSEEQRRVDESIYLKDVADSIQKSKMDSVQHRQDLQMLQTKQQEHRRSVYRIEVAIAGKNRIYTGTDIDQDRDLVTFVDSATKQQVTTKFTVLSRIRDSL